jgi:hypothetical protein
MVQSVADDRAGSEQTFLLGFRRNCARLLSRHLRGREFGWADLERELDRCAAPVPFWWRDDDAVAATPALTALLDLRTEIGVPLALAVIPAPLEPSLVERLAGEDRVSVLQHGWDHANHAAAGAPQSEYPAGRIVAEVQAQVTEGRQRLEARFPTRFLRVFVPPFNALDQSCVAPLRAGGLCHVSLSTDFAGLGLPSRNVHADVIDWRLGRAVPAAKVIRSVILALRLRRFGLVEAARPIGVLTHHLVHDDGIWALARELLGRLHQHENAVFVPIEQVFA